MALNLRKKAQDEYRLTPPSEEGFGNVPLEGGEKAYKVVPAVEKLNQAAENFEDLARGIGVPGDIAGLVSELVLLWSGEFDVYIPQENITPETLGRGLMQIVEAYSEPAYTGSEDFPQTHSEFIKAAQWFINNGFIQGVEPIEESIESFTGPHVMWWRQSNRLNMLNMKKKAETVYVSELLWTMTQGLERLSANYTVDGAEAVVNFQSENEQEPQQYHIRVTPMSEIERRQEAAGERGEYSWGPEGPPPGIVNAVKLNMKKKALEIGGETFPDALKFKDKTPSRFDIETSIGELYQDAETSVINYIWDGLREHGIIGPDDANVIQTDVDKVRFSNASFLVNQLMEEGWFTYLAQSPNVKLRSDPQLQQQVFDTIQNAIREGAV